MNAVNPYVYGAAQGADFGLQIIGMILQKQSLDEANLKAEGIDYRNFQYQQGRDKVSDKMAKENLKIAQRGQALNEQKFALEGALSKYQVNTDQIDRVGKILNNNVALKDRVLKTWSV